MSASRAGLTTELPKVSVVCAWYNRADYIQQTIDSLLSQDFGSFEIVVVNDGSPDPRVGQILDGYRDTRVRVIHQVNGGFVQAIRRAINESRGAFIAVMGAGDLAHPARLRRQFEVLSGDDSLVGVSCWINDVVVGVEGPEDPQLPVDQPTTHSAVKVTRNDILKSVNSPFSHGEVMYRRSAYEAVGGYREFFRFAQDMDLWLRIGRYGNFQIVPEVLYERRNFRSDGVSMSMKSYVAQIAMARTAQRCAREFDVFGFDIVDIYGPQAGLFRESSAFMSRFLAKTALKYLRGGYHREARWHAGLALREHPGALAVLAWMLVRIWGYHPTRALSDGVLRLLPIHDVRKLEPLF